MAETLFEFNMQYIKDVSFENPQAPLAFMAASEAPQVQIDVEVGAKPLEGLTSQLQDGAKPFEVTLIVRAQAMRGTAALFVVDLTYAGIFTVRSDSETELQALLMIEAPRLLFPFARAHVATLTRDGGFPPLLLNPIDFAALAAQNKTKAA